MSIVKTLTAWSYSRWKDHDTCPRKAKYKYVDKIPETENAAMVAGSFAHTNIADYLMGKTPEYNPLNTAPVVGWTYFGELYNQLRSLNPLVEQEWAYDAAWRVRSWFHKKTWLRVKLDAGVVYDDATADVVDIKTGRAYPEHAEQGELYAVGTFIRYPEVERLSARFWYTDSGHEEVYRFSTRQLPMLVEKWEERGYRVTEDKVFPMRPGRHCAYCPYGRTKGGPCRNG